MRDKFPEILAKYQKTSLVFLNGIEEELPSDLSKVTKFAHSLKGSSSALGAVGVSRLCQKLEEQIKGQDTTEHIRIVVDKLREAQALTLLQFKMESKQTEKHVTENSEQPNSTKNVTLVS